MNRLNTDNAARLRRRLDELAPVLTALTTTLTSGFAEQLAAAVAEARAKVPRGHAVADEDLQRSVRPAVRRAWLTALQQTYRDAQTQTAAARELFAATLRAAREFSPPAPPPGADTLQRIEFGITLANLRAEFPRDTPLTELWDAYVAADTQGDRVRAAHLEVSLTHALDYPTSHDSPRDVNEAARIKRRRDAIRTQLEARRDARLSENDRENFAAWERELTTIEGDLARVHRGLLVHARAA